ncbi:MAG: 1,4-alpha-glucan branching protein GlgB [Myxococcales bacterium]|nr:1,4-alpha-glucan branching protein GlgB [Myxococcales bacterium]
MTWPTEHDLYLFNEGSHFRLWEILGAHPDDSGTRFGVWAPSARAVHVMGDFNGWSRTSHPLQPQGSSGIWAGHVPGVGQGTIYKYAIHTRDGEILEKADPVGVHHETPPKTGSIVWPTAYEWGDAEWMARRAEHNHREAPISIYELHLGSFRRVPEDGNRSLSFRELAPVVADHCVAHGFTHVELLPVSEHPFDGSWGYQVTGYFAPTSRFGTPQDFMYFVDVLHQRGVGVIVDWVPAHFPTDVHGLARFDGTALYEHDDPRKGFHPDWTTYIFNYGRHEVRSFLISSAACWIDLFHVDGIRVDGVASMLYLDYSRNEGEWIPNEHGGRENLDAVAFLRRLNEHLYGMYPGIQTYAEESTAWPAVTQPTYLGGLGFGLKWDMGWMHDTLLYVSREPVHRKYHHGEITFRAIYHSTESYVLPLSHDEVVHGKGSLLSKMPGDEWQRFANLRLLYAYQWAVPGKKLLFMGGELAQPGEWNHDGSLDWHLLDVPAHAGIGRTVARLNALYREEPALHERDLRPEELPRGFDWVRGDDAESSTLAFLRWSKAGEPLLVACNFTPVPRHDVVFGVPRGGYWEELFNSDATEYGGGGVGNLGGVEARAEGADGRPFSVSVTLPPLACVYLRPRA